MSDPNQQSPLSGKPTPEAKPIGDRSRKIANRKDLIEDFTKGSAEKSVMNLVSIDTNTWVVCRREATVPPEQSHHLFPLDPRSSEEPAEPAPVLSLTFDPDLSNVQVMAALRALTTYYRACGINFILVELEEAEATESESIRA